MTLQASSFKHAFPMPFPLPPFPNNLRFPRPINPSPQLRPLTYDTAPNEREYPPITNSSLLTHAYTPSSAAEDACTSPRLFFSQTKHFPPSLISNVEKVGFWGARWNVSGLTQSACSCLYVSNPRMYLVEVETLTSYRGFVSTRWS